MCSMPLKAESPLSLVSLPSRVLTVPIMSYSLGKNEMNDVLFSKMGIK